MVNYNIGARYRIVGRVLDKTKVSAYALKDSTDKKVYVLDKDVVEHLALNKQIYNCNAQVYGDIVNLRGIQCKLSEMPRYSMEGKPVKQIENICADLLLVGKVQTGRVVREYVLKSIEDGGKTFRVGKEATIQLAKQGRIVNARVQMNRGKSMLRGVNGSMLNELKSYNI